MSMVGRVCDRCGGDYVPESIDGYMFLVHVCEDKIGVDLRWVWCDEGDING